MSQLPITLPRFTVFPNPPGAGRRDMRRRRTFAQARGNHEHQPEDPRYPRAQAAADRVRRGRAGGNAVNNMITAGFRGSTFVVANTDAQGADHVEAERIIQMGVQVTEGLGAGSQPDVGALRPKR